LVNQWFPALLMVSCLLIGVYPRAQKYFTGETFVRLFHMKGEKPLRARSMDLTSLFNPSYGLAVGLAVVLVIQAGLAVWLLFQASSQRQLRRQLLAILRDLASASLEEALLNDGRLLRDTVDRVEKLAVAQKHLEGRVGGCLQRVGIVRFRAFEDTGSDLSFSIALLDSRNNGVVLTSLYGRSESLIFAKPVMGGESPYSLSREEKEAISRAGKETEAI